MTTPANQPAPSSGGFDWNPLSWPGQIANSFFTTAGGDLATGISTGLMSFLGDLWKMIAGPVYIAIGVLLIVWAFTIILAEQIFDIVMKLLPLILAAAK